MRNSVLVTGGNGFIGSHVIEKLVAMDYNVVSVDRRQSGSLYVMSEDHTEYLGGAIQDYALPNLLTKYDFDHIIHLGAWSNVRESMEEVVRLYRDNVLSTVYIIDAIIKAGVDSSVKSVVFASSSAAEFPESHYGVSKMASEMMLNVFRTQMGEKVSVSNLRFGNVYGPRQNPANGTLIASLVDCVVTGSTPQIYGDGKQERDYIYVTDVAEAIIMSMEYDTSEAYEQGLSDTLDVCQGISFSVDEVYDKTKSVCDRLGYDLEDPEYLPKRQGDKYLVKMRPSQALKSRGWDAGVFLSDGIRNQILWAMEHRFWDADRTVDGELM